MMPVVEGPPEHQIDYKQKYKALKRKLKFLVYEQECFLEELRKSQRKLLKVSRDRSFLLDRLLQYDKVDDSSGDSDITASSDSDADGKDGGSSSKRKRMSGISPGHGHAGSTSDNAAMFGGLGYGMLQSNSGMLRLSSPMSASDIAKKRPKAGSKRSKTSTPKRRLQSKDTGPMSREELERHLESKQNAFGIEKATAMLPMEIFSNDNSNPSSDILMNLVTMQADDDEDSDLVIDIPK